VSVRHTYMSFGHTWVVVRHTYMSVGYAWVSVRHRERVLDTRIVS